MLRRDHKESIHRCIIILPSLYRPSYSSPQPSTMSRISQPELKKVSFPAFIPTSQTNAFPYRSTWTVGSTSTFRRIAQCPASCAGTTCFSTWSSSRHSKSWVPERGNRVEQR